MIVYRTTNLENNKSYIGKDVYNRPRYLGSGKYIVSAIKKYGKENFKKEIIAHCYTQEHLNFLEKFYIQFYCTKAPDGYNLTDGGDGAIGYHHSEEAKTKIGESSKLRKYPMRNIEISSKVSRSLKGRIKPESFREKCRERTRERNPAFGKSRPDISGDNSPTKKLEVRDKISKALKGKKKKPFTEEHRRRISEGIKERIRGMTNV